MNKSQNTAPQKKYILYDLIYETAENANNLQLHKWDQW